MFAAPFEAVLPLAIVVGNAVGVFAVLVALLVAIVANHLVVLVKVRLIRNFRQVQKDSYMKTCNGFHFTIIENMKHKSFKPFSFQTTKKSNKNVN